MTEQTFDETLLGSPEELAMARLLTEVLAHECMVEPWDDMAAMDKSSMVKACEVLLANWDLMERARNRRSGGETVSSKEG